MNSIISDPGEPRRQQWDSQIDFLMSCISMSVGLGNVWRFPYVAYTNGGGAFIIPYMLVLFLIGRPFYSLEISIGQFSSSGGVKMWDMVPAVRGVGYGQTFAVSIIVTYYTFLIALAFYYLVVSFATVLPWTVCDNIPQIENITCVPVVGNFTSFENESNARSSAEIYFNKQVLKRNTDISGDWGDISGGLGTPDVYLVLCLALSWLVLFLIISNGISFSGKVAYFTAIFPYTVLFAFLVMAGIQPGAGDGVLKFFEPQWDQLYSLDVWYAAITQSFFSLSIGFGSLVTYSSFNKFRHNTNKDSLIISFADTGTSFLSGAVVFAVLGSMAHQQDKPLEDVVASGTGLAFVVYPVVIANFPAVPQLFAVLFFVMLITLGLGTSVGLAGTVANVISDALPSVSHQKATTITCLTGFALGIPFTTPGGLTALDLMDYFGGSLLILILAVIEIIAISWVYGTNRIKTDIDFMLKDNLGEENSLKWWFKLVLDLYWRFCVGIFCPIVLPLVLIYALVTQTGMPGSLPAGAYAIGGIAFAAGVLIVPIYFAMSVYRKKGGEGGLVETMTALWRPAEAWGPASARDRSDWVAFWQQEGQTNPIKLIISKFKKTEQNM